MRRSPADALVRVLLSSCIAPTRMQPNWGVAPAATMLRRGIANESVCVPRRQSSSLWRQLHPIHGRAILQLTDALREPEEFLSPFRVLYPTEPILRNASRFGRSAL